MQLPRGGHQEYEIHDDFRCDAERAPLPRTIQESHAPGADEHPDVVSVDEREQQNVSLALVVRAVAAPAGALVEKLLPRIDRRGLYDGVLVEVVADLGTRDLHHLVDEHVVVAARKVDELAEPSCREEQLLLVGKARGRGDNREPHAEPGRFHRGVPERLQFLVQVQQGMVPAVLLWPLHNAYPVREPARHRGNPALARNAVGVNRQ